MRYDFSEVREDVIAAARTVLRDGPGVQVAASLTKRSLAALAEGRLCAIRVPGFFWVASARRAARAIAAREKPKPWSINRKLATDTAFSMGTPKQYAALSKTALARYHREAIPTIRRLRELFAPGLCPMDRLRLELDELWPAGAHVRHRGGTTEQAGLVRTIDPRYLEGVARHEGICHIDTERKAKDPHGLSANLYLEVPPRGGELQIWDVSPDARNHRNALYRLMRRYAFQPGSQEVIRAALAPAVVIRPRVGDLILIDTARPHAVRGFSRGTRMTIQAWVIAHGREQPLQIYS
jgi:hypothetical protein